MNESQRLLRHFVAALAYRTQVALRDAPEDYSDLRLSPTSRTPHEIVWHMTGVIGYACTRFTGGTWTPERLADFEVEVERLHTKLEDLAAEIDSGREPREASLAQLLQGPLADAMTHVGQLAFIRRLAGSPVPPENFMLADVDPSNVGQEQASPRAPKAGWRPDQPPPPPGRRDPE